jgi:hypothetical protein
MYEEAVEICKNDQAASLPPDLPYVLQRFAPDIWERQGWPFKCSMRLILPCTGLRLNAISQTSGTRQFPDAGIE